MYQEKFESIVLDRSKLDLERGIEINSAPLRALALIDKLVNKINKLESNR